MADENEVAKDNEKQKRVRSPAYPGIGLAKAVEHAKAVYAQVHRHPATPATVARALGFSDEKSGPASSALSALKKFGLLMSDEQRRVQLSPWALDIILAPSVEHPPRKKALREAALAPIIYGELWEKWGECLPPEEEIGYYLERERNFNPKIIPGFIRDYRESLEFAELIREASELTKPSESSEGNEPNHPNDDKPPLRRSPMKTGMKEDTYTLDAGQAVLQWPDNIRPDEFEDLEMWLQLMIRKVKRSVRDDPPELDE